MPSSLGKNSLITLAGQLFKTFFQGLSFILIARTLGANDFGILVSILALCSLLSPFVDFGGYHLIVKRISNNEQIKLVIGESTGVLLIAAPFFVALLCLITASVYDYSILLAALVGVTALLFDKLLSLFIALNISRDHFKVVAVVEAMVSGIRFLLSLILLALDGDLTLWVFFLFVHGVIATLIIFYILRKEMKRIPINKPPLKLIYSGFPFVWNQLGGNANQDFDKICLSKISGAEIAGVYAAVMRVLNIALIPIYAFYMTVYSRYFKAAHDGIDGFQHALKMLLPSAMLGIVTSIMVFIIAPYVPLLLGTEYKEAVDLIKIALIVPILQTLASPFADTLSGYGKQNIRVYILFFSVIINILLNLLLIPDYEAYGALVATIVSHFVFFLATFWFTYRFTKGVQTL